MTLKYKARAFTLVELLTVIAVLAILAGIMIPTLGGARRSAQRAETRVRFSQWAIAMEQFRQEYGYYPQIDGDGAAANKIAPARFAGALTGRRLDGSSFSSATDPDLAGNKRRVTFYTIAENELSADRSALADAFGNTDIAVYYDRNGDGRITTADTDGRDPVSVTAGSRSTAPGRDDLDLAGSGVRAGVIFYSAGSGAEGEIVYSWK